jgi:hypothetical protein
MSDRRMATQEVGLVERWVRTGKAYYVSNLVAILTSAALILIVGGRDVVVVSVICLTAISGMSYDARRVERIRRGKGIRSGYCPEHNPKPLGI